MKINLSLLNQKIDGLVKINKALNFIGKACKVESVRVAANKTSEKIEDMIFDARLYSTKIVEKK